jgi:hypothetical protein
MTVASMVNLKKFQTNVATGSLTLPVVAFLCLFLWGITSYSQSWNQLISLAITAFTGYLMIESNTSFTLIRTRTLLPACIYCFLVSSLYFFHPFDWKLLVPPAFLLSLINLFRSYESNEAATSIFHSFLFISWISWVFPPILFFVPLFFFGMIPFRSFSVKSIWASLLGILTPYWFLLGYAFCTEQMELFKAKLHPLMVLYPIDYSAVSPYEGVIACIITILLLVGTVHYWNVSYMDKTRTRVFLSFMSIAGLWATLIGILQPVHIREIMQIQLIIMGFLNAHLFTLTQSRFSSITFIVTFVVFILIMCSSLWMQFFNF